MTHTTHELGLGWWIHEKGQDVLISGPGGLEIDLNPFDADKLEFEEGYVLGTIGRLMRRSWHYPLPEHEGESRLSLLLMWASTVAGNAELYKMYLGTHISWILIGDTGHKLWQWFSDTKRG